MPAHLCRIAVRLLYDKLEIFLGSMTELSYPAEAEFPTFLGFYGIAPNDSPDLPGKSAYKTLTQIQ